MSNAAAAEGELPLDTPEPPKPVWNGEPQWSAYAGYWLLLPVLVRLRMAEFLAGHPHLVEADFPARLLRHVASRLGIARDNPALAALTAAELYPRPDECAFVVPEAWPGGLCSVDAPRPARPWRVRRVVGMRGARVLTDGYGADGLVLAQWRGGPPAAVRALVAAAGSPALERDGALDAGSEIEMALRAWVTAARRWCRRYAGLGLRALVARPGHVATTRTHVDVFFCLSQADLRLRKAGLDIDPGWVPWLGRVVLYHYQDEEPTRGG